MRGVRRGVVEGGSCAGSAQPSAMNMAAAGVGSSITSPGLIAETSTPFITAASFLIRRTLVVGVIVVTEK
jgi:hypothetical protein